jgi:hypothetical protein
MQAPDTCLPLGSLPPVGQPGCSLCSTFTQQATVILWTNRVHPSRPGTGITSRRPAVHNLIMRDRGAATT